MQATDAATVADVGERALIARLRARLPAARREVVLGVGDDAAVIEPPRGQLEVVTTDTLVEGVHFDQRVCGPVDIGHKALAVNVSDLAAMGAEPRLALLSLGLPDALPVETFDGVVEGFLEEAAAHRVTLVGGNITRSTGPLFIDVTAIGTARRRRVLRRDAGRPGDELYVTGTPGAARAGLTWLMQHADNMNEIRSLSDPWVEAVGRYRRPEARVRAGVLAARSRVVAVCMDLSDGLADAVTQIAGASGVGAEVDLAALPLHQAARTLWPADAAWQSLLGGDDYELLFAVSPRRRRSFMAALATVRWMPVTRIGRLTPASEGTRVRRLDGSIVPLPAGYEHFGGSGS